MVAASRTLLCVTIAFAAMACGVVLPPADGDDVEGEPGMKDPITTKGAAMPPPESTDDDAGVAVSPGADDGGTSPQPSARVYGVFVTSQTWSSDQIGGLAGADQKCASLANAVASLAGKKWAAWLSDASTSALSRLGSTPGPWSRVDGVKVALDRGHLASKLLPLFTSISVDEQRASRSGTVWTGTSSDGSAAADVCGGWTGTNGRGVYGEIDFKKPHWTSKGTDECDGNGGGGLGSWSGGGDWDDSPGGTKPRHRLYCFEID